MAVKLKTKMSDIDRHLRNYQQSIERRILRVLQRLGEECYIKVVDRSQEDSWIDRTGNLRSSIGYVIVKNGIILDIAGFEQRGSASEGMSEGRQFAMSVATRYKQGYSLIVVAGMNYAAYVEAMDSKDVLASSESYAKRRLPVLLRNLFSNV